jgi:hypothetical protein
MVDWADSWMVGYWVETQQRASDRICSELRIRTTDYHRPSRSSDLDPGEEIGMVLSLEPDATSAPNPTSEKPASREAPSAETRPNSSLRPANCCAAAVEGQPRDRIRDADVADTRELLGVRPKTELDMLS